MDITPLFKGCVKTVRTKNKAFGVVGSGDKSRILKTRRNKNDFSFKAKDIIIQITRLRDFLLENRKAYLNFANFLSDIPQMTDAERDQIDLGAQKIMNTCSYLITDFKRDSKKHVESQQVVEHIEIVLELVENYLKAVCKIYSEQKAVRVKRALEMRKLAKLENEKPNPSPSITSSKKINEDEEYETVINTKHLHSSDIEDIDSSAVFEDEELSPEDMQMFEAENVQLYNELNNLTDEVQQIESKVVHIAELQEIFTEKVLEQEHDIDRIASTVVGATENVKDANEQIRQAIQRNAGLRVWVLFFLLVMSFSLLFLDWYND